MYAGPAALAIEAPKLHKHVGIRFKIRLTKQAHSPENESAPDELPNRTGRALNRGANQDQDAADENADTPSVPISNQATERERCDLATVIDDKNDARARPGSIEAKGLLVGLHGIDRSHEGAVWIKSAAQVGAFLPVCSGTIPNPFMVDTR